MQKQGSLHSFMNELSREEKDAKVAADAARMEVMRVRLAAQAAAITKTLRTMDPGISGADDHALRNWYQPCIAGQPVKKKRGGQPGSSA